ncbi:hypothetical protein HPB48_001345 [Haemaphysalis longicornis]|uniref:CCHC-type domain-containing protein n=1 Tax=Haemaphysalis longicornis TaxID=44386 RepID=A0A9J6FGK5_HAELO|nr:hypothetical protein HPB48_001345 [Haemaphysalis longicornis]
MNHIWLVKFRTPAAVIGPIHQDVSFKELWVPFDIIGECLSRARSDFGDVKSVKHDAWAASGFEPADSTSRVIQMTLRPDVTPDDLPQVMKFYSGQGLVVVPGQAPLCFRCRRTGYMRRECRVPWCFKCRSFGHTADECVRTCARVVGGNEEDPEVNENLMKPEEAEAASKAEPQTPV